jgi:hypothetical protein
MYGAHFGLAVLCCVRMLRCSEGACQDSKSSHVDRQNG